MWVKDCFEIYIWSHSTVNIRIAIPRRKNNDVTRCATNKIVWGVRYKAQMYVHRNCPYTLAQNRWRRFIEIQCVKRYVLPESIFLCSLKQREPLFGFVLAITRTNRQKLHPNRQQPITSVSLQIWDMRYGSCYISNGCIKYWFKVILCWYLILKKINKRITDS